MAAGCKFAATTMHLGADDLGAFVGGLWNLLNRPGVDVNKMTCILKGIVRRNRLNADSHGIRFRDLSSLVSSR